MIPVVDHIRKLSKTLSVSVIHASGKRPNALSEYVDEINAKVQEMGRLFTKYEAGYLPVSPPPFFWNYQCRYCRFWIYNGCIIVEGEIAPRGWCTLWLPPDGVKPLSWLPWR